MKEVARPPRWTYEDYLLFPDDGKRYEIIRGEKIVTPAPIPKHQRVAAKLLFVLMKFLQEKGLGEAFIAPIDVVLDEDSVVQPDILFIAKERLSIIGDRSITAAPDLVIEVLSASTHRTDHVSKRKLYGAYGVREYWIVDPEIERVEQFLLEGGTLEKRAEATSGDLRSLAVLPGFTVPLAEVFR